MLFSLLHLSASQGNCGNFRPLPLRSLASHHCVLVGSASTVVIPLSHFSNLRSAHIPWNKHFLRFHLPFTFLQLVHINITLKCSLFQFVAPLLNLYTMTEDIAKKISNKKVECQMHLSNVMPKQKVVPREFLYSRILKQFPRFVFHKSNI